MRAELQQVLAGRTPTAEDVPHLIYTKQVLQESMRLHPPAPVISREPVQDDCIDGFQIQAGSIVSCPVAIVHRDPAFWEKPDAFMPERFDRAPHPFTYLPFGAGPRVCVGENFAMLEALLVLSTLAPRFEFQNDATKEVVEYPLITMGPKGGLWGWLKECRTER